MASSVMFLDARARVGLQQWPARRDIDGIEVLDGQRRSRFSLETVERITLLKRCAVSADCLT